jgi:SPP1 gp7 family putative phage head morphogenesis protein
LAPKKTPAFGPTKKLERAYAAGIAKIVGRVLPPKKVEETFDQWLAAIAMKSQEPDVIAASQLLAQRMVGWVNVKNAKTWREAAARSQQSRKLYSLLEKEMQGTTGVRVRAIVNANATYIRSIPLTQASVLVSEVLKAQQQGARAGTIAKMYKARWPELLRSRVSLIARTETAKASTALTQARCEDLDIDWYVWLTSEDGRVRDSHRNMNLVLVPWSQEPAPEALVGEKSTLGHYHAGACPNCRCTQRPVLTLEDVKFPARVYWQGAIHTMNKQQFKTIAVRLESRAA